MPPIAWAFFAVAAAAATYFVTQKKGSGGSADDPAFLAGQVAQNVARLRAGYDHGLVARFQVAASLPPNGLYDAQTASMVRSMGVPNAPSAIIPGGPSAAFPGAPPGDNTWTDIAHGVAVGDQFVQSQTGQQVTHGLGSLLSNILSSNKDEPAQTGSFTQRDLAYMARNNPEQLDGLFADGTITNAQLQQAYSDANMSL